MHAHRARRLMSFLVLLALMPASGCPRQAATDDGGDTKVGLTLRPEPPRVGEAKAVVTLADKEGHPVRGAAVKLEGNMNHAGMTPVFADAKETEPGRYEGALEFTMGGDWFVLVNVTLADGRKLSRKVDVPGVKRGE